jgi:hypothetical protein
MHCRLITSGPTKAKFVTYCLLLLERSEYEVQETTKSTSKQTNKQTNKQTKSVATSGFCNALI